MKQEMKIELPLYKIAYSAVYTVILCLIRGIAVTEEIGAALDANMGLLAIVFCAETWVMERSGKRWEIFALYPPKNKNRAVFRRFFLQLAYLWPLSYLCYFFFFWQKPANLTGQPFWQQYGCYFVAITVTLLFWGALSVTASCLFQNQWAGIGSALVVWMLCNSTFGEKTLGNLNIFAYSFRDLQRTADYGWLWGKAAGVVLTALMLAVLPGILKKRG